MSLLLRDTPIEAYCGVYVKREDLCAPPGAPPFSKIRGLVKHLEQLKREGVVGVAYVETSVSMAGWGVAWACAQLGLRCLIFNPIYKHPPALLEYHREQWLRWGAELRDLPAGRAKVNYYIARNQLPHGFHLLPLGLPLPETISETRRIAAECIHAYPTVVVCVGSGTIAAGLFQASRVGQALYGIMSRTGNVARKTAHIKSAAPYHRFENGHIQVLDPGWEYANPCNVPVPFPCHPYYDAKAWQWLMEHASALPHPILFWNIGSTGAWKMERGAQ